MNHLAHFHLSAGDEQLQLGALLGDYVKGPLTGRLPGGLENGIWLHRKVDAYTDQHHETRELQQRLDKRFRRYSGIMLDVVFDYFLSQHWSQFHHHSLQQFSCEVYDLLGRHDLPDANAQQHAQRLAQYDVLCSYMHWSTVEAALQRIHQRLQRDNPLLEAADELASHYRDLELGFLRFYPQLIEHCQAVRQQLPGHSPLYNKGIK